MRMWFFQATKLVSELTIIHSQTRCELWLKTNLSFLTSTEALLAPKSDKHLISPYNITPESNMEVMRID